MTEAKAAIRQALEEAEKQSDPAARQKALAAVAWDAIDIDREVAQEAFAALTPGGEDARRLIAHFAMRLGETDPDAALEWARGLEEPAERDDAMGRVALAISASDPQRAVALATEEVPEGLVRDRTFIQITQRWSQAAPVEAANWVASLPSGRARNLALQRLVANWSASDAPAFATWASQQEALRPELVSALANSLRIIPDEATRSQRLAAFNDSALRQLVEEDLAKSPPLTLPPLPTVPAPPAGR